MTKKQLKYVYKLLEREGLTFMDNTLALEYSNYRTDELEELTHQETQNLIAHFVERSPKDKMQGKILSMAHELRWELPNGKINMERLNAWCIKHTPHHKPFNSLTEKELPIVVSIFEKMYYNLLNTL